MAAITVAGGLYRIVFLAVEPLWRDEAFTAVAVQRPLADMLAVIARDSSPPLHYLLEHAVAQVSTSPPALRLISALAGTALIPLVAALARRIRGDPAGLWAAAFVAVLPATVVASRDARGYALGAMLVATAALLLWRAIERPSPHRWVAYSAAVVAAIWAVYFAALAVVALVVAAAWALRPPRYVLVVAVLASIAPFLTLVPWLVFASAQFQHVGVPFWVLPPSPMVVTGSLAQFWSGPLVAPSAPGGIALDVLQGLAVGSGLLAFVALWLRRDRLDPGGRQAARFCAVAGTVGPIVLLVVSPWRPLFEARYAAVLWVPLFALAGTGLALASRRVAVALVIGLALPSLALSVIATQPATDRLLTAIETNLGDDDILSAYPTQYLILLDEGSPRLRDRLHVISSDVPWFWGTAAYPPGAVLAAVPDSVLRSGGRILYVAGTDDPGPSVPAGYRATQRVCAPGVCLTVFGPGE